MIDRFGLLPEHTRQLFRVTSLKLVSQRLGIQKIEAGPQGGKLVFEQDTPVDPLALVQIVQSAPECYRLEAGNQLRFQTSLKNAGERIDFVHSLLEQLERQAA
jgi:transcription-repair coupling factor (superfamily II helicase)